MTPILGFYFYRLQFIAKIQLSTLYGKLGQ